MNREIYSNELEEFDKIISRIVYLEKEKAQAIQQLKELEDRVGIPFYQYASMCRWESYKEAHNLFINSWKNCVKYVHSQKKLVFDFTKRSKQEVYRDLVILFNHDVFDCSLRRISVFIVSSTNLDSVEANVYQKLKRIKTFYK